MAKKWIGTAIKKPGRITQMAKRQGISKQAAASKAAHSSDPSLRGAGVLAQRFMKGGDLHGGNTKVSPSSMKGQGLMARNANLKAKCDFKTQKQDAREGF